MTNDRRQDCVAGSSRRFPEGFIWGVATSAYQIEGSPLADGAGSSNWHEFCHQKKSGHIWCDQDGDLACDHYRRYRQDVGIMADLGVRAYRFSISWSRVLPWGVGKVNERGLDFYRRLLDALDEHQVQSMVTLFHWDLPQPLAAQGGWRNPQIVEWFREYARVVFHALGDRVGWWSTINEPWVVAHFGFMEGSHPPGIREPRQLPLVSAHLLRAHAAAVQVYRERGHRPIGLVVNLAPQHAATSHPDDGAAALRMDAYFNRQFLQPALTGASPTLMSAMFADHWVDPFPDGHAPAIDFVGVNYYTRQVVRHQPDITPLQAEVVDLPAAGKTAMGWEIYPAGLTETLVTLRDTYGPLPIYITENGAAFDDVIGEDGGIRDKDRTEYLRLHLLALTDALAQEVPVAGYFVWSLLDNFEWTWGLSKRFGLVHVDFATQRRTIKDSGKWYRSVISGNRIVS